MKQGDLLGCSSGWPPDCGICAAVGASQQLPHWQSGCMMAASEGHLATGCARVGSRQRLLAGAVRLWHIMLQVTEQLRLAASPCCCWREVSDARLTIEGLLCCSSSDIPASPRVARGVASNSISHHCIAKITALLTMIPLLLSSCLRHHVVIKLRRLSASTALVRSSPERERRSSVDLIIIANVARCVEFVRDPGCPRRIGDHMCALQAFGTKRILGRHRDRLTREFPRASQNVRRSVLFLPRARAPHADLPTLPSSRAGRPRAPMPSTSLAPSARAPRPG